MKLTKGSFACVAVFAIVTACAKDDASRVADALATDAGIDENQLADALSSEAGLDANQSADAPPPDAGIDAPPGTVLLGVTLDGAGAGTVTSSPAGISCTSGSCAASFDADTVVSLTAAASIGSTFTGWSGACTGTGECTVTMTEAHEVTATFTLMTFTLEVTKSGDGAGTVTGNGLDCGGTCTVALPYGTAVALTATASTVDATASTFTGWSGPGCSGTGQCTVTLTSDLSFDAAFKLNPNLMFTSSVGYDGNLGGLAGADAKCQVLATAKGLKGNYRAYLGATAVNAPSRFAPATGWTRVDGKPVVNAIGDFGAVMLPFAPSLDEAGNDLTSSQVQQVWTATAATTEYYGQNCNNAGAAPDWSATPGRTMTGVLSTTDGNVLTGGRVQPCGVAIRLYCFGIDRSATVP